MTLHDGKFKGTGKGLNGDIIVEVTIKDKSIKKVDVIKHDESAGISDVAIERIPRQIAEYNSLDIDTVSGATIASKGIIQAVDEALKASGGSGDDLVSKKPTSDKKSKTPDTKTDVLVIGGGGVGLTAAIQAKNDGHDVILLEKNPQTGGTFVGSEGLFGVESSWQKEAGIDLTVEKALDQVMEYHHYIADEKLYRKYFEMSGETITWLEEQGIKFQGVQGLGDSMETWHLYDGKRSEGLGVHFMKTYTQIAQSKGVDIRLETVGKKLIMEEGKVAGVIAEDSNGSYKIEAPVVILGTGGYGENQQMMEENLSDVRFEKIMSPIECGRTGDGINMALEVGGRWAPYKGTTMFFGPMLAGHAYGSDIHAVSIQPTLWVNEVAERFVNEYMYVKNFSYCGNAMTRQKRTITIASQAQVNRYKNVGPDVQVGVYVEPGTPLENIYQEIKENQSRPKSEVYVADTLEELADLIKIDKDRLLKTVEQYNQHCRDGLDPLYGKPQEFMQTLEEGPYYAFDVQLGFFSTVGGLKIDTHARVLDDNDEPISGLYAGGCDAGGLYGDSYDVVYAAGSQAGWAVNSGRLASKHANKYLNE